MKDTRVEYDAAIVLGHQVKPDGRPGEQLQARLAVAVAAYKQGHTRTLILSGGKCAAEPCSAAHSAANQALGMGVPAPHQVEQGDGLDTTGEAVLIRCLVAEPKMWRQLLVVTSEYHLPRVERVFRFVFGGAYIMTFAGTSDGYQPTIEVMSAESTSMNRFNRLVDGLAPGEIGPLLNRFWTRHRLYHGTEFLALREQCYAACSNLD